MLAFSIILNVILIALLVIAIIVGWRFAKMLFKYEEILPITLDKLEESFKEINAVLQTPVGSDDPFIRRVIKAIKNAKDAILFAAQEISNIENKKEEK
jgi:hypothetical protein